MRLASSHADFSEIRLRRIGVTMDASQGLRIEKRNTGRRMGCIHLFSCVKHPVAHTGVPRSS